MGQKAIYRNEARVKAELYQLTGLVPRQETNRVGGRRLRAENVFDSLAEKVFDSPQLLKLLTLKMKQWLTLDKSEFTYRLAGYIFYFQEDFGQAERHFFCALRLNPVNIDNWIDLAFAMYHQGQAKHELAKKILLRFDEYVREFAKRKVTKEALYRF